MHKMLLTTIAMLVLAACGDAAETVGPPTTMADTTTESESVPTTEPGYGAEFSTVVEWARADLAARFDIEKSSIEAVSAEAVTWSDGSLGCPEPGMMYTQALIEGSRVVLEHDDRFYDYHAGAGTVPFLCESEDEDGGHGSVPPLEGAA